MIERSSEISALLLTLTTCAVIVYCIFYLTEIFNGNKKIKTILRIGGQEIVLEEDQAKTAKRFNGHKIFWITIGLCYLTAFLTMLWYIIAIFAFFFIAGKLLVKARVKA